MLFIEKVETLTLGPKVGSVDGTLLKVGLIDGVEDGATDG